VFRRIPLNRGLGLEEAENAVQAPPPVQAVYPFRGTSAADGSQPGPSRPTSDDRGGCKPESMDARRNRPADGPDDTQSPAGARPSKPKKGTVIPYHSRYVQKYSCNLRNGPAGNLLKRYMKENKTVERNPELLNEFLDLIAASLAQSTWRLYDSALRLWKLFKQQSGKNMDFLDVNSWSESFIVWGWSIRHLATSTLKI
jgi:hypothetical protein